MLSEQVKHSRFAVLLSALIFLPLPQVGCVAQLLPVKPVWYWYVLEGQALHEVDDSLKYPLLHLQVPSAWNSLPLPRQAAESANFWSIFAAVALHAFCTRSCRPTTEQTQHTDDVTAHAHSRI